MSMLGQRHTDAAKERMSASKNGRHLSAEHRKKISDANRGRRKSKKTRRKISAKLFGIKRSDATRQKISEGRKRYFRLLKASESPGRGGRSLATAA